MDRRNRIGKKDQHIKLFHNHTYYANVCTRKCFVLQRITGVLLGKKNTSATRLQYEMMPPKFQLPMQNCTICIRDSIWANTRPFTKPHDNIQPS